MAERCGGGRWILDRIRWKKKLDGNKFPVKFCLPAVVSRPAGKHALRNLRRRRPPRSIEASKSIESTSKNNFREKKQNQRRVGGKLFGPRKSKCVNFLMQTLRNAYDFSIVFERLDRSRHRKSIESTSKNNFREKKQNQRRVGGKLFGPRKSKCVDFLM